MSRSSLRVVRAALAATLLLGGFTLAFPSNAPLALADGGGFIKVYYDRNEVQGFGWGDPTVAVTVNGTSAGTANVAGDRFSFSSAIDIVPGDVVEATGAPSGYMRTLLVADVSVATYDVPGDLVVGTVTPALPLTLCIGGPGGTYGCAAGTPAPDGSFTADFGTVLDLQQGMGGEARVPDADGDETTIGIAVPSPMVEAWWAGGVAVSSWAPDSDVTLTLDDTNGNVGTWTVHTDVNGFYWGVGLPPGWQYLEPGWIATATGPVTHRESPVLTKTTRVFAYVPTITETTVSGTLPGVMSNTQVGAGSRVEVSAWCDVGNASRTLVADPVTGAFSVDVTQPAPQDQGWGDCTPPIVTILIRYYDSDGDMSQPWWVRVPTPKVTASPNTALMDGAQVQIHLEGWDMNPVVIQQCELVGGQPGSCDPATAWRTLAYPPASWPYPPYASGDYGRQVHRYLTVDGNRSVDCAAAAASCAVVVTELYRPGEIRAWAPLTFTPVVAATVSVAPNTGLSAGQSVAVSGSGFPNGVMLITCLSARNGDGGWCDMGTMRSNIQTDPNGNFSTTYNVYRQLSTGHGSVDCGSAPGACSLVAFDPTNPYGRSADASLTFAAPLGKIKVGVSSNGTAGKFSGWATLTGTVKCSNDIPVLVTGSLWQRIDKRHVAQGTFSTSVACRAGRTVSWTSKVVPAGMPIVPFGAGKAQATVHASAQRFDESVVSDATVIVKLAKSKF